MMVETVLSRSVRLICAGGMALGMPPLAQEAAPVMRKVEVTGSRIPTANLEGPSPVTVMSAKEIKIEGVRSVENLLNNLPQVFADQGGTVSNGASGTATVNLRNFGADRTLVLVNGRRLPAGSPLNTAADLNQIPCAADQARRSADRRRIGHLRFRRRGRRGQLHHGRQLPGRPDRAELQLLQPLADMAGRLPMRRQGRNFPVPGDNNADGKIKDISLAMGGNFAENRGNATVFFGLQERRRAAAIGARLHRVLAGRLDHRRHVQLRRLGHQLPGPFPRSARAASPSPMRTAACVLMSAQASQYNFGPLNYFRRPSERYTSTRSPTMTSATRRASTPKPASTMTHRGPDRPVRPVRPRRFGRERDHLENPLLSKAWKTLGLNAGERPT